MTYPDPTDYARRIAAARLEAARAALRAAAAVIDQHAESWRAAERDQIARNGPNYPSAVDAQARAQTWASAGDLLREIAASDDPTTPEDARTTARRELGIRDE